MNDILPVFSCFIGVYENDGKGETLVLMIQAKTGQLNAAKFSQHYIWEILEWKLIFSFVGAVMSCREMKRKVHFFVVPWHCMFGLTRHVVAFRRSLGRRPVTLCRMMPTSCLLSLCTVHMMQTSAASLTVQMHSLPCSGGILFGVFSWRHSLCDCK